MTTHSKHQPTSNAATGNTSSSLGSLFGSNVSVVDYINGLPMAVIFTKGTIILASSAANSYFSISG